MGLFYSNITLKGPAQTAIVRYLSDEGHSAIVSPTVNDVTTIYDEGFWHDGEISPELTTFAAALSSVFACVALVAAVYDGDIFSYHLYVTGSLVDEYDSEPGYFSGTMLPPHRGDASLLCAVFDALGAVRSITDILVPNRHTGDSWMAPDARHRAIAAALALPPFACSTWIDASGEIERAFDEGRPSPFVETTV